MSIKRNFAYSSILTGANYIFPLIVFPYVSRVLGVTNIGIYNFVDSIINYCILFSMMGIGVVGIREIAKNKDDKNGLKQAFSSLLAINGIFTLLVLLGLLIAILYVPKLQEHSSLMWIGVSKIIFNLFLVEWFFKGVEDFKYITVRTIAVRIVYVVSVLLFVQEQEDYGIYYALTIGTIAINAVLNWKYLNKFTRFGLKNIEIKPYLKPILILGIYTLLTSMYTSFNVTYLGFVAGETEVGYYTTATKLYGILLALFTAFTGVMLPRMSALVAEGNIEEVKRLTAKSYDILFVFCFPVIILTMFFAPQIIQLIAGTGYEGAILPMRIVMPLVLIIGIEQILIIQLLMPLKMDKAILINSIVGAAVGLSLNILLVPVWKSVGSSIVWFCSEMAVLISAQIFLSRKLQIYIPLKSLGKYILQALPFGAVCYFIELLMPNSVYSFIIASCVCCTLFVILHALIFRSTICLNLLRNISSNRLR